MRGLSAMRPLYCAAHEHFARADFPIAFHVPTDSMQFLADALANFRVQIQLVAIIFAVAMLIEALRPAQPRQPWRNVAFNLGYTAFVVLVNALLLPPLLQFLQPLVQRHGLQIPIHFPDGLGWQALQALVFLFIHDFFYYWFHRAQHRFPFAWPLHKLHHADESVNVTTSLRHHWLEEPFRVWLILVPIGLWIALKLVPAPLMAEFRNAADLAVERPISRLGAALIIGLWAIIGTFIALQIWALRYW